MDIVGKSVENYRNQSMQKQGADPLSQLANSVGLKINSPEAAQKLQAMGQAVAQQASQSAQIQQANAVEKATTGWKQSFFQGKV